MPDRPDDDDTAIRTSPGASSPGEPGYEGHATVGDEGAAAGDESYEDPFGRPSASDLPPGDRPPGTGAGD